MDLSEERQLLVVSSYPEKGKTHGKGTVGIASYAKNTLTALSESNNDIQITVLAEILPASPEEYQEGNITVKRIWKRGSLAAFWNLTSEILRNHKNIKNIMLQLELAMFGSAMQIIPLPIFLVIMRIIGKKVTVVTHQVIPNISDISGHMNQISNFQFPISNFVLKFYSLCIQVLYRAVLLLSARVIVFDEVLRKKLKPFGNIQKIAVIPHGVEEFRTTISRTDARKKLNIKPDQFVVLSFGFLAWYKGTDWLVDAMKSIKGIKSTKSIKGNEKNNSLDTRDTPDTLDTQLILAGGANPNHIDKPFYKKYIDSIEKTCEENGFLVTGFVAENDIATYYLASDLVVLPYRTLMSASGPLSIALSFKLPFLVSSVMAEIFETTDIKQELNELNLDKNDLSFTTHTELSQKIEQLQENPVKLKMIAELSSELGKVRSWKVIGEMYRKALFS